MKKSEGPTSGDATEDGEAAAGDTCPSRRRCPDLDTTTSSSVIQGSGTCVGASIALLWSGQRLTRLGPRICDGEVSLAMHSWNSSPPRTCDVVAFNLGRAPCCGVLKIRSSCISEVLKKGGEGTLTGESQHTGIHGDLRQDHKGKPTREFIGRRNSPRTPVPRKMQDITGKAMDSDMTAENPLLYREEKQRNQKETTKRDGSPSPPVIASERL